MVIRARVSENPPRITVRVCNGRLPRENHLRRLVDNLLTTGRPPADFVIALTDVYTGTREFADAEDAMTKMRAWVGPNDRFFPHAAQYELEAWLLPYWERICKIARAEGIAPFRNPETVNHDRPPSRRLDELFRRGKRGKGYTKTVHGPKILDGQDLTVAAAACPQLKAMLNTILRLSGTEELR